MRRTYIITIALMALAMRAPAQAKPPAVFALVGVRIEIGDGRVIEKGTIVLRDGLIEAVGAGVVAPPDAEKIAGDGLTVYPGFIDASRSTGLNLPEWQPDQDVAPDTGAFAPASMREANRKGVRPELRAEQYLGLTDAVVSPIRRGGFTTALIAPSGGTICGESALVNLNSLPTRDCVLRTGVAMDFSFDTVRGGGGFGAQAPAALVAQPTGTGYPGSLMGIIALLRQTMLDAQYYRAERASFEKGGSVRPPADESLSALQPVIGGTMPVAFAADTENQVIRAMHLADEFHFKLIIDGGTDAWKQASALSQRKIPVLVSLNFGAEPGVRGTGGQGGRFNRGPGGAAGAAPGGAVAPGGVAPNADPAAVRPQGFQRPGGGGRRQRQNPGQTPGQDAATAPQQEDETDVPTAVIAERHRLWMEKVANAAKLQQAGVPIALSMAGTRSPAEFFTNLRRAIQAGLPRQAALAALTTGPATLFGVGRQLGTIDAGKIADLVVMTGDFADAASRTRYVFVDRLKFDVEGPVTPAASRTPNVPAETEEP